VLGVFGVCVARRDDVTQNRFSFTAVRYYSKMECVYSEVNLTRV
jgi:hypothetical protein